MGFLQIREKNGIHGAPVIAVNTAFDSESGPQQIPSELFGVWWTQKCRQPGRQMYFKSDSLKENKDSDRKHEHLGR